MVSTRLTQQSGVVRHDRNGETDVKTGGKEMENQQQANNMMAMFERMLQEQRAMSEILAAVERPVQRNGQFNGRDVSRYLRDYKAEMLRCRISEGLQVTSFNRVATDGLQGSIHGLQQQNPTWEAFEEALKTMFAIEDSSKATRRGFEDWVETPNKGMKVLDVFSAFESRFGSLSARDQAILVPDKVIMFLRAVDVRDRKDLGVLLEDTTTESGLTDTWDNVREIVARYTKRGQWLANEEKRISEPIPKPRSGLEDHQPWARETTGKGIDATTVEQLLKDMENLKIAMVKKSEDRPSGSKYMDRRCIWCDSTEHDRRDCDEHKEALRRDLIYYEGNRIHSMDSRKPLRPNFRKGGMKKILEEEISAKNNYATTAGIRVGESSGTQASFWPEVLEISKRADHDEVRSAAECIREATGWECPVDKNSVHALCQLHEVYVDEKRRRTDDAAGPSKTPESWNSGGKGKEKTTPAFKLASDIEQQTDLKKVFEERILDSRVEFSLRELLGIAKKEFHDLLVDLVKRKRQSTEENAPRVNANTVLMNDTEVEDEIPNSHYTKPHWARATTETPVRIGNIKEPVLALIDHGSEINLMSKEFYRKGKWPINTNHGWKIRAATKATEELFAACPDVTVKIGDVEIDQNFFVQDEVSHAVILGQPFITASRMETKVLDSGAAFARIRSQNGGKSVQFLTVPANHERNKRELLSQTKMDF